MFLTAFIAMVSNCVLSSLILCTVVLLLCTLEDVLISGRN